MGFTELIATVVVLVLLAFGVWRKISDNSLLDNSELSGGNTVPGAAPGRVQEWQQIARKSAAQYGLPWQVILAQIWQESSGQENAYGSAGEIGLMQLKPIAVRDLEQNDYGSFEGWTDNPEVNVLAGAAYLDLQRKRVGGDIRKALGAYNQGYQGAKKNRFLANRYASEVLSKAELLGY